MPNETFGQTLGVLVGSGGNAASGTTLGEQLTALTAQLRSSAEQQSQAVSANTKAISTAAPQSGGSSAAGIGSAVVDFFGAGLGLSPLLKSLLSLFGGGGSADAPPALTPYAAPASVSFEGLFKAGSGAVAESSMGQGGAIRELPSAQTAAPTQITVQVQAMDSRSFLDHSDDIARAVRLAMLQSNVLNDVVREI